ncbi:efflux RND transporter periplasmic adaptor subunit [Acidisphaera rubrifaciens]|uniref:Multidrug resistance efflux pump n=1 Tax=Acidisphaera rubrifaciens HS-AP3 TaxID=1231350 RepID=A0A0D6P3R7_9PROT|nr:efflux RND transporter periplasmic adaptor subunit [Acidisphaera rubrifaciens]GAN75986.1 multidrug resistance efflux pump [Acidisphaera rubrifaciens HS-AP3]
MAAIIVITLVVGGILIRTHNESALAKATDEDATPSVDVITPRHTAPQSVLRLPGDVQAWYEAPIYAQVSGYLRMWYKDIGAVVKAGDLLAVIDTPELDQQLRQAQAALGEAVANEKLAEVTAARWQHLLVTNAVSRQSTDVATSDEAVKRAAVAAAQADVDRLHALEAFKRLIAPFDGVVTVRRTDVGALIRANGVSDPELFAVADIHAMRVYVRVPQSYTAQIHVGMQARLRLPDYPDRVFAARVITAAHQIALTSRTMLVELEAPNPDGALSPGSYATVEFELRSDPHTLILPTSALIFQQHGMQVATVVNGRVALRQIRIGRDTGTEVEITSGIGPKDEVIDSPPDSLASGEQVRVAGHHPAPPNGGAADMPQPGQ